MGKDCTKEDVVTSPADPHDRENTDSEIAKLIADTVAHRSLDIRNVVKFRCAMQVQTEEEANRVE